MPPAGDACEALSDDIARAVHPDFKLLDDHGFDIRATADAMLACLDELGAMLGTLRAEGREQREALEPVLEAFAEGMARDFAYVDSVEDTVNAIENAVADTERQLSQLEQSQFRNNRLKDVEAARRGIEELFAKVGGTYANLTSSVGGLGANLSSNISTATSNANQKIEKAKVSANGAVAAAKAKAELKKTEKANSKAKQEADSYWEESGDSPRAKDASNSVVSTLSESVGKVWSGLGRKETEPEDDGPKGNIPST